MRALVLTSARARGAELAAVFSHRPFAIYQAGGFLMTIGFWMQRIAVGWLTWVLTGSEGWLGLMAFAELFPSILTGVKGGQLADRHPAPKIMLWGHLALLALVLVLFLVSLADRLDATVMLIVMIMVGAISGLILPARISMAQHLAPRDLLPTALAVSSTSFNASRFIGPALASVFLIIGSPALVFGLASLGYVAAVVALWIIRDTPNQQPRKPAAAKVSPVRIVRDLGQTPIILAVIGVQLTLGLLIRPASELFPAFSETVFQRGEAGLGYLNAALGLGAIIGALALSKARPPHAALRQILLSALLFGGTLIAFALTGNFALALLILLVHGVAMSSGNIAALAFVQLEAPQDRLGRIMGLYTIVFRAGPAIGAFLFGLTAEVTGLLACGLLFGATGLTIVWGLGQFIVTKLRQHPVL